MRSGPERSAAVAADGPSARAPAHQPGDRRGPAGPPLRSQGPGPARSRQAGWRTGQGPTAGRERRRSKVTLPMPREPSSTSGFDELSEEQRLSSRTGHRPGDCRAVRGKVREAVLKGKAEGWRETPEILLAAIILLDQFSRNIFRGTARAFEGDALALELRSWRWSGAGSRRRRSRGRRSS